MDDHKYFRNIFLIRWRWWNIFWRFHTKQFYCWERSTIRRCDEWCKGNSRYVFETNSWVLKNVHWRSDLDTEQQFTHYWLVHHDVETENIFEGASILNADSLKKLNMLFDMMEYFPNQVDKWLRFWITIWVEKSLNTNEALNTIHNKHNKSDSLERIDARECQGVSVTQEIWLHFLANER